MGSGISNTGMEEVAHDVTGQMNLAALVASAARGYFPLINSSSSPETGREEGAVETGRERRDTGGSSRPTVALLVLAFLDCGGGARAGAVEPEGIAGCVLDKTGAGVASAKVWVVVGSWEEPETVAEATADGQGAFPFPRFWEEQAREGVLKRITHSFSLVARDGGGRIGR
jgi:hypothetical protein